MKGGEYVGERVVVKNENFKAELIFNMKCQYNCQLLFAWITIFIQAIPGNDQNASPTNKKTAGSNLDRTS